MFKKAVKRDAKLRLALCGPAGSGKTFTTLLIASALGKKIAYVDTEHGSASKYAHTDTCGGPGACIDPSHFDFDVIEPSSFDPRELVKFIDEAVKQGYDVICGDSLSHYWMGPGGELDLVDAKAKTTQGNSFAAWKTVTPFHNALVDKMISASIHVIVTMRTKTEWVVEKDEKGKNVPRKIGMAPVMRDGVEYEFDVCGDLDQDNNLVVTKSRCSALQGKVINRPGKEMAATLIDWLAGAPQEVFVPTGPPSVLKPDPFKMRDAFAGVKADLSKITGSDDAYYRILGNNGFEKSNQITDRAKGASIYGEMRAAYKSAMEAQTTDKDHITDEDVPALIGADKPYPD